VAEYAKRPGVYFVNDANGYGFACRSRDDWLRNPGTASRNQRDRCADGDTALIRGIAAAAKQIAPRVKIVGCKRRVLPLTICRGRKTKSLETETCDTIADGLATRTPEAANVRDVKRLVDEVRW